MDANAQEAIAMYRLRKADDVYMELKRKCRVVLEDKPFANGGMRHAFRMRIVGDSNLYVAKEFLEHQSPQMYREEWDVHQTALELANLFNAQKPPKGGDLPEHLVLCLSIGAEHHRHFFDLHPCCTRAPYVVV